MKKIISVFISAVMVMLTFSGCSFVKSDFVELKEQVGLDNSSNCCISIRDNKAVIISQDFEYAEQEIPTDENGASDYEPELEKRTTLITLLDLTKYKIIEQRSIESKEDSSAEGVDFKDENTIIVKYYNKAELYDLELNDIKVIDFDFSKDSSMTIENSQLDPNLSCTVSGVADFYGTSYNGYIFKSDPDRVYINDNAGDEMMLACSGKKLIFSDTKSDNRGEKLISTTFSAYDYENNVKLNSYTFDLQQNDYTSVYSKAAMNDSKAVIALSTDKYTGEDEEYSSVTRYYIWDFARSSEPSSIDIYSYDNNEINEKIDKTVSEVSKKNNITIAYNVDTVPYYDKNLKEEDKFYVNFKIKSLLTIYDNLLEIEKILDAFPKGMVGRLDNFKLFLVNYITGCGAYANNTMFDYDTEQCYFVVMSTSSISDLPHELMHCFENYVNYNSDNSPFYDEYDSLNIIDFYDYDVIQEHGENYAKEFIYNENNADTACFVTDYATTNSLEDKAELFQCMFNIGYDKEIWGYNKATINNCPIIKKKAQLISKTLRQYFPEIKETPIWEKVLENN